MQVTSLLSQAPETAAITSRPGRARLWLSGLGALLVANAYLVQGLAASAPEVAAASALVGSLLLGGPLLLNSVRSLRRGEYGINELVSLAILAALASGDYQTAGVVAFFMVVGELIETRTAAGARAAIEALVRHTPDRARRLTSAGAEEEVPAQALRPGDVIRVRPGDNLPADGCIRAGRATLNEASITGESLPVDKGEGEMVFAGSQNLTGVLEVEVTRAGADTTLGKVRSLILAAEQTKLPIMRLIDQYAGYYTPLVLVMGMVVWMFTHDLPRVIAVLVIACPCAFILATPTAMVAALAAASRVGLLIKNVGELEVAAKVRAFLFDKTGTLTVGRLRVARLIVAEGIKPAELLYLAASAEQHSNHPVARAVVACAREVELPLGAATEVQEAAGLGLQAQVDGAEIRVGRLNWLRAQGVSFEGLPVASPDAEGLSLLHVARNGRAIGAIGLRDEVRPEARESLAALKRAGVRHLVMVTGDREAVARMVAREVGCDEVHAECLPQDKVVQVEQLKARGYRVAVVGDGVNDAPALAAGDLGIAMGAAGSDVAIHSASIALMNSDLRRLPFLVELSRAARRTISQNFLIGLVFIVGGLTLAAFGYINPIVAAILHNTGSLLVVFNSARLVRSGEDLNHAEPVPAAATRAPATEALVPQAS